MLNAQRISGIVLLVLGVVLIVAGLNASDSLADRWSNFFTGHYTDTTVWYLAGGIASAVVGLVLTASGRRRG
jgi:succinate dehydrogenase hydrophobic anchor subunit